MVVMWLCVASLPVAARAAPVDKATAADKQIARKAFEEGTRRYNLGEYDAALESFKNAYLHVEDPAFLFNIAQCHRALGQKEEALKLYRSFLRENTKAPESIRQNVAEIIDYLQSEIAKDQKAEEDRKAAEAAAAAAAQQQQQTVAVTREAPPRDKPIYKKWWLWTAVGGVVVAGVAVGLAVGLTRTPSAPSAPSGFQTLQPAF